MIILAACPEVKYKASESPSHTHRLGYQHRGLQTCQGKALPRAGASGGKGRDVSFDLS